MEAAPRVGEERKRQREEVEEIVREASESEKQLVIRIRKKKTEKRACDTDGNEFQLNIQWQSFAVSNEIL